MIDINQLNAAIKANCNAAKLKRAVTAKSRQATSSGATLKTVSMTRRFGATVTI
jgi:hypothetical protein